MDQVEREALARKRLRAVLDTHGIATARTLEQKISDAGPNNQRIDPHVLTTVRNKMEEDGELAQQEHVGVPWYHLVDTDPETLEQRLAAQQPIYAALHGGSVGKRIGQALEIAVFRALCAQGVLEHFGAFSDLDEHDDGKLYSKEEPPAALSGRRLPGKKRLDFLIRHPTAGWAAVEVKNVREWLYVNRTEIRDLLLKATCLDIIPVLIARRIPFVTFKVLSACGVVIHQTYNQRLPNADAALAEQARRKDILGFHDILVGNEPDPRLTKFIGQNLPTVLPEARAKFNGFKDLLTRYGQGTMKYKEFAARVRRRSQGLDEDSDIDFTNVDIPEDYIPEDE